jgi:outer membrane protein assembly factor BamB
MARAYGRWNRARPASPQRMGARGEYRLESATQGAGNVDAGASVARRMGARSKAQFVVHAFSRISGRPLWEYKFDAEGDKPPVHIKHNLASPSCATDGELVDAWMGTGQLVALDLNGKLIWKRHLGKEFGPFEILWGHGSSPLIYKESLILLCDHQGKAYILSLDKRSGKQRWKLDRGADRRAYSTPFVIPGKSGDELVINSSERIDVLDPVSGALLWSVGDPNEVPVPTPVYLDGVLYTSRGYSSGPYMAVVNGKVKWEVETGAPYVSSLLYYEGVIYMATEMGIASGIDAADGKLLWRERFGGLFSASPVAAAGKVYLINEEGDAFVLQAGRELKILHRNQLGERTLASPAISQGQIFIRTDEHLICIGKK